MPGTSRVQRSLSPTISMTVAYVGNKGTHTLSDGDGNNTNPNEAAITLPAPVQQYSWPVLFTSIPRVAEIAVGWSQQRCGQQSCNLRWAQQPGTTLIRTVQLRNQTLLQRYVGGTLPACGGPCGWTQSIQYNGDNQNTAYNALQITLS